MTTQEIYKAVEHKTLCEVLKWFRAEDRTSYQSVVAGLAQDRKVRPVFVQKKPVAGQFRWIHDALKLRTNAALGEHLLQVFFMKGKESLLVKFCDALGIAHDGKGGVTGDLPDKLDPEELKEAVSALLEEEKPEMVTLYLRVFNMQRVGGWPELTSLLEEDERLGLGSAK